MLPEAVAEAAGWSMHLVYFLRCAARTPTTLHVVQVEPPPPPPRPPPPPPTTMLAARCRSGHDHRPKEGRLRDKNAELTLSKKIMRGVVRNLETSSGEYVVVKHGRTTPGDVSAPLCARCGFHSSAELSKNEKTKVHLVRIPPFTLMPPHSNDFYNQDYYQRARYTRHPTPAKGTHNHPPIMRSQH